MKKRVPKYSYPVPMPDTDSLSKERIEELLIDNYLKRIERHCAVPSNPNPVPMPDIDSFSKERIAELLMDNYLKRIESHSAVPSNPKPVPMPSIECDYQKNNSKNTLRRII